MQNNVQPIHAAASHGHVNIVQMLIDVYEIDPTVKAKVATYVHMYVSIYIMYFLVYIFVAKVMSLQHYAISYF